MSLKDNFNQAVKEILKKDGFVGKNLSDEAKKGSELDNMLGQPPSPDSPSQQPEQQPFASRPAAPPDADNFREPEPYADSGSAPMNDSSPYSFTDTPPRTEDSFSYADPYQGGSGGMGGMGGPGGPGIMPPPQPRGSAPSEQRYNDNEETTVISKNIVINGGTVTGFANVRIDGSIKGDVKITKDVTVTGKVVGDIECNNAVMTGSQIQGSVMSKGQVRVDRDSTLLGDISTQYLDMNGRIKGNVDVAGKAEFKSDSVILGDITASSITVLDGAAMKGFVNTTFLQESSADVFPDAITVSDK